MEAVISKWGNSSAVRLPKPYLQKLGINENDTVKISVKGNLITIEKPHKALSFSELALAETGLSLDEYVTQNPYDSDCYIDFGNTGAEEL